ncbi:MAG TPA: acylphosphatase [Nocardioidaceae bacterium]|jgi:acylphosphatase|nr:acylphosphatase [Nocardioidaceae bacterium]
MNTPMSTDTVARAVVVRGLVQGVFFRDSTRRIALDTGVFGWVGNEPDGSVRAVLEGPRPRVEEVVAWMREGPRDAVVEDVEVTDTEVTGRRRFEVR